MFNANFRLPNSLQYLVIKCDMISVTSIVKQYAEDNSTKEIVTFHVMKIWKMEYPKGLCKPFRKITGLNIPWCELIQARASDNCKSDLNTPGRRYFSLFFSLFSHILKMSGANYFLCISMEHVQ